MPPELTPSPEKLAQRMHERFTERPGGRIVAEVDGELRGFCFFGPSRDEDAEPGVDEIHVLFVAPQAWRQGVGRALLERTLADLEGPVTLWSAADNARANAFYERLGLERDGAEQTRPEFGDVREIRYRLERRPPP